MREIYFLIICITSNVFSQIEIKTPTLKPDIFLEYDIAFQHNNPKNSKVVEEALYNEDIIRHRIDSLNQLTPLNLVYNQAVAQQIKFYLLQRKEQVSRLLSLSEYYFPIFEKYLDQNELPLDLKYLPIIESSLNSNARSYAGAVGLWQFMYPTAKEQGLRINSYLDERKDVYKSTEAACNYLSKAYKVFNDWDLALSSYNAGRRNITKAIRRSGGVFNYWELRPFLPKETRNYIPSFIAALYVMNFAAEHGIDKSNEKIFASYEIDTVYVKKPIKMSHLAQILQIDTLVLERLNPAYRIKLVPSIKTENFPIVLPYNKVGVFITNEASIYQQLESMELAEKLNYPEFTDIEKIRYKVKSGDYLGKIAKKNQCTIKDIMLWNDLKSHNIKVGQRLNIYRTVK